MPERTMETLLIIVMQNGETHSCEPFIPHSAHVRRMEMIVEGRCEERLWVATNPSDRERLERRDGGIFMVTLRNASVLWWGLPTWGLVLPARLVGGSLQCNVADIDFDATMDANGGNMPFILTDTVEETN